MKKVNKYDCKIEKVHKDKVDLVTSDMPEDIVIFNMADIFKVFGDTTRIKILYSVLKHELCVCDIANIINMTHSAVSHQLRVLKQARLVKSRKDGKEVYYSLDDVHVKSIFNETLTHIREEQ